MLASAYLQQMVTRLGCIYSRSSKQQAIKNNRAGPPGARALHRATNPLAMAVGYAVHAYTSAGQKLPHPWHVIILMMHRSEVTSLQRVELRVCIQHQP